MSAASSARFSVPREEEGASHLSWWSDVIALLASLVFAWPWSERVLAVERLSRPKHGGAIRRAAIRRCPLANLVNNSAALREPLWTRTDHWVTLIAFGLVVVATVLKVISRFPVEKSVSKNDGRCAGFEAQISRYLDDGLQWWCSANSGNCDPHLLPMKWRDYLERTPTKYRWELDPECRSPILPGNCR